MKIVILGGVAAGAKAAAKARRLLPVQILNCILMIRTYLIQRVVFHIS